MVRAWLKKANPVIWFTLAFLLMCCAYEMGRVLNLRPEAHHFWRQTDCLSLAWNYYDTTWNLFEPAMHSQLADGGETGKSAGEFPLLYYVIGLIWRITGPSEMIYRSVGLLLHFLGTLALFGIVRRVTHSAFWGGAISLLLFTSPAILYFGVAFLTDVPALDISLIGWWFLLRHSTEAIKKHLIIAISCFALAMLLKVTAGMSLIALLGVLFIESLFPKAFDRRVFRQLGLSWMLFTAGLGLVFAWYAYADHYNELHHFKYTFNDTWSYWSRTPEEREAATELGWRFIVFQIFDTSVWILVLAAIVALLLNFRRIDLRAHAVWGALLIGSFLYTTLWYMALNGHDYYWINPMIAPIAILVLFVWWLGRDHPAILGSRWAKWAMSALLLYNVAYASTNQRMRYNESGRMDHTNLLPTYHERELLWWNGTGWYDLKTLYEIGPYLDSIGVDKKARVLFCDDESINGALVIAGRRGWTSFGHDLRKASSMDHLLDKGLAYIIASDPKWLNAPHLQPLMTKPIGQFGNFRIFDVRGLHSLTTVFKSWSGADPPFQFRSTGMACSDNGSPWCFGSQQYPLEMKLLPAVPLHSEGTFVRLHGRVTHEMPSSDDLQLIIAEDSAEINLSRTVFFLTSGPFDVQHPLLHSGHGTSTLAFLWNRSNLPFRMDSLELDMHQYISP
ncbi:MAG: glycosyltransferase family 39 protein [Flavobacteriales bacterium]|nr:glycosyltransferase family 39 protein [Flavobacteriales bacterium]